MAMNRVQFQAGLSMTEFLARYGTEAQCAEVLAAQRWPEGFRCPACGSAEHSTFERAGRRYSQCRDCRHQTTVIAGTIFEATKLPLTVWFLAMHLLTQAKNNISALELKRHLGVCYRTAWLVKHKLLQVMVEREADRVLAGRVEIDDAYLGGECPGTPGRGSTNKVPFVIAVETNERGHPLFVKLSPTPFTKTALAAWSDAALDADAYVLSDGLGGFRGITGTVACHHRIIVGSGRAAVQHPEFRWVNTILGNLKTAITGTYHAFDFAKYAYRYLAEVQYRFNRRFDLRAILGRLVHAAVATAPWPEHKIRLAEVHR
jgi:ribosomal protein L37AE/L43A